MGFETMAKRGVQAFYGVRTTNSKFGGNINDDVIKTAQWTFNFNELPTGATSNLGFSIPANATIVSANLQIITAFTSTSGNTDLEVGLEQADGTDIDLNGLLTTTNASQTTIGVVGANIAGTGALVGNTIGAAAGELIVSANDTDLTAGKARLIVKYLTKGL